MRGGHGGGVFGQTVVDSVRRQGENGKAGGLDYINGKRQKQIERGS